MTVEELIKELKKCPRDYHVMFCMESSLKNEALTIVDDLGEEYTETSFSIDDVLVGGGTERGFVYLSEELL